ncbi:MAG: type 4a pilus biogenesis protein PilO [Pirellulales bacterium]|nr:type 4a pilus biogenesis protein PilO [Pirellulales bacterium]
MSSKIATSSWTIPFLVGAAAAAYLAVVFLPGQRALARLHADLVSQDACVAQAGDLAPAIQATEKELEDTVRFNRAWQEASPTPQALSGLFGRMNQLAKDAGVSMTRFDPEPVELMQRIRRVPVLLGCTGTFPQVCELLQKFEHLPQAIWIHGLQLEVDGKNSKTVKVEVALSVFADNSDTSGQVDRSE